MRALLILFLCTIQMIGQENDFSLVGKTEGISDGSLLLLQDPLTRKFIDTAIVKDNSFVLKTTFNSFPYRTVLWKDGSTAREIWVENTKMTFDASKTNFESAIITGSFTDSLSKSQIESIRKLKSMESIIEHQTSFIKKNPSSLLSAYKLSIIGPSLGQEKVSELYSSMSEANRLSVYGEKIADFLQLDIPKAPKIGEKYVDFAMKNPNGEIEKLSDHKGKFVLLEFWASWCVPCRKNNPELVKIYNDYRNKGLEIFAVSMDESKERWIKAIEKDQLDWRHVSDLKGRENEAVLIYRVDAIPKNFLINPEGIIVGVNVKGSSLTKLISE